MVTGMFSLCSSWRIELKKPSSANFDAQYEAARGIVTLPAANTEHPECYELRGVDICLTFCDFTVWSFVQLL